MAHDVFICHSSRDKPVADAACAKLEARGMRCWIAPRDVTPGAQWAGEINRAIREAQVLVLIYSGESNGSDQVLRELERAVASGTAVLPFRIEDVPPTDSVEYYIASAHWLDAMSEPLDTHLGHLADAVGRLTGFKREPVAVQQREEPPPAPVRSGAWRGLLALALIAVLGGGVWWWTTRDDDAGSDAETEQPATARENAERLATSIAADAKPWRGTMFMQAIRVKQEGDRLLAEDPGGALAKYEEARRHLTAAIDKVEESYGAQIARVEKHLKAYEGGGERARLASGKRWPDCVWPPTTYAIGPDKMERMRRPPAPRGGEPVRLPPLSRTEAARSVDPEAALKRAFTSFPSTPAQSFAAIAGVLSSREYGLLELPLDLARSSPVNKPDAAFGLLLRLGRFGEARAMLKAVESDRLRQLGAARIALGLGEFAGIPGDAWKRFAPHVHYAKGEALEAQRAFAAAMPRPASAAACRDMGLALAVQNRGADARRCFDRAVQAAPDIDVAAGRAFLVVIEGAEDMDELRTLAGRNPGHPLVQYYVGCAFERRGDAEKAAWAFRRALGIEPRYTFVQAHLRALGEPIGDPVELGKAQAAYAALARVWKLFGGTPEWAGRIKNVEQRLERSRRSAPTRDVSHQVRSADREMRMGKIYSAAVFLDDAARTDAAAKKELARIERKHPAIKRVLDHARASRKR